MNRVVRNVRGVLFDLDGVFHVGNRAIDGADEALRWLDARRVPYRILTNTTTATPDDLHAKTAAMGLSIPRERILTTHEVASSFLKRQGQPACYLLVSDHVASAYDGIERSEDHPDWIVIGDIGDRWNYSILNRVFNMVMDGARLLALHKGRYWQTEDGLQMDIGAFVTGLEYTTGTIATVIGKPERSFFEMGLEALAIGPEEAVMIGDDIESDVGGAQKAGIRGVLVETGKYRAGVVRTSRVEPDAIWPSVAELPRLLEVSF